jgi:hypothetical protein
MSMAFTSLKLNPSLNNSSHKIRLKTVYWEILNSTNVI